MTKQELISEVLLTTPSTTNEEQVKEVIDRTMDVIKNAVACGDTVTLRGFGSFVPARRKQKVARVIKTGEAVIVPAQTVPTFKASKAFRDSVKLAATIEA
ncbi:HU family DNA-binding protein [Spirosoma sp.]|uniref:HU family DNA-binding protein n=1 Tax=Spirosoma sp. TaxID=1899569 RepID=UPI00261B1E77|nr:HU family DNA-binding protein [Spirosoma sp.]MCX6217690.1 integration host factor subunit beta [Spirosoma sp.]